MVNYKIYLQTKIDNYEDFFEILINNSLVLSYDLSCIELEFTHDTKIDWNLLTIKLYRQPNSQSSIQIDEIFIDNCAMRFLLNDNGEVIPDWSKEEDLKNWFKKTYDNVPNSMPKRRILDMSGVYNFKYFLPIKKYLDDFYIISEHYKHNYNQPLEEYLKLEELLQNKNA